MNNDRIEYLHEKFLKGALTAAEKTEWQQLVDDPQTEDQVLSLIERAWMQTPDSRLVDMSEDKSKGILKEITANPQIQTRAHRLWPRIAIAAAIATIIFGAGLFYYNLNHDKPQSDQVALKNDVAPGKTGATLTLANGKKIKLSDAANGEVAEEAGVMITKSANGQLVYEIKDNNAESNKTNTLSTANGETYQLRLPDGSLVWLNSASSLTYAASLNERGRRIVRLSGEGYFEVAKDKVHPFVVQTAGQEVEVLGTHFNINSYADEPAIATTLVEGSVRVKQQGKEVVIKPGQQALSAGTEIKVREADLEGIVDWKEGDFNFGELDFKSAMRKVARWYNVEVVYETAVPAELVSGGWFKRSQKLSTILKAIENTGLASFSIKDRTVYVRYKAQ